MSERKSRIVHAPASAVAKLIQRVGCVDSGVRDCRTTQFGDQSPCSHFHSCCRWRLGTNDEQRLLIHVPHCGHLIGTLGWRRHIVLSCADQSYACRVCCRRSSPLSRIGRRAVTDVDTSERNVSFRTIACAHRFSSIPFGTRYSVLPSVSRRGGFGLGPRRRSVTGSWRIR